MRQQTNRTFFDVIGCVSKVASADHLVIRRIVTEDTLTEISERIDQTVMLRAR